MNVPDFLRIYYRVYGDPKVARSEISQTILKIGEAILGLSALILGADRFYPDLL